MRMTKSKSNPGSPRRRRPAILRVAAVALLLSAYSVGAEELPAGTSTGTLTLPDGTTGDVTYEISGEGGGPPGMTMMTGGGRYALSDVRVGDGSIAFQWVPGDSPVQCTLQRTSGRTYVGKCPDPAGGPPLKLTLTPPAAE